MRRAVQLDVAIACFDAEMLAEGLLEARDVFVTALTPPWVAASVAYSISSEVIDGLV